MAKRGYVPVRLRSALTNLPAGKMVACVWTRLPNKARKAILAYWEKRPAPTPTFKMSKNSWYEGMTNGLDFWFDTRSVAELDRKVLLRIVAHEFGHAYRKATGAYFKTGRERRIVTEENWAERLADRWGFKVSPDAKMYVRRSKKERDLIERSLEQHVRKGRGWNYRRKTA